MACVAVFSEKVVLSFIPFIKTANPTRAQSLPLNLSYKAGKQQRKEEKEVLKLFKLCCLKLAGPLSLTRHSSQTVLRCTLSAEYCHLWCNGRGPQPKDMALYFWTTTLVQPWIKRRQAKETVSAKHTKVTLKELYTKWFHLHMSHRSHTLPFHHPSLTLHLPHSTLPAHPWRAAITEHHPSRQGCNMTVTMFGDNVKWWSSCIIL